MLEDELDRAHLVIVKLLKRFGVWPEKCTRDVRRHQSEVELMKLAEHTKLAELREEKWHDFMTG